MTDTAEKSSDFLNELGDAARRSPMSAAPIGMGNSFGCSLGESWNGTDAPCPSRLTSIACRRQQEILSTRGGPAPALATNSAADTIRQTGSASIETATRMGSKYRKRLPNPANVLDNVRGNLHDLGKAQPKVLGAIGLALALASLRPCPIRTSKIPIWAKPARL